MDSGAHFYRCDFQLHTPRDLRWSGPPAVSDEERLAYGRKLVDACRQRGIQAIAITDHHCMAFLPFIRRAASEELNADGSELAAADRLIVFPGIELTLGVPCQALLIFDADFPDDMFSLALNALAIVQTDASASKVHDVSRLDSITLLSALKAKLDEHAYLRDRYIIFPNVTGEGPHSLLRNGQAGKYTEMPCVGGYVDGTYESLSTGTKNRLEGKDRSWGHKRIACIQTSDSRRDDHSTLGNPSTWIKWSRPSAEALRQACLAQESRISLEEPRIPETYIASVSVSNSAFLGPVDLNLNPQYSALIGGRGTGKSTVLEYIRWALCDQPPSGDTEDSPNYQARRSRLIDGTLSPHGATVEVVYVLNGVPHIVRRTSVDGAVSMKIGSGELQACTEDEVRTLLPIQAYSQKQLSDVSVRVEELTRFITAPIKGDLDRLTRKVSDRANHIREAYATWKRFRDLSQVLRKRVLEEQSIREQANLIRASLTGLSEDDRALLELGPTYATASSAIAAWKAGVGTVRNKALELLQIVKSQKAALPAAPDNPAALKETMSQARLDLENLLESAQSNLDRIVAQAEAIVTAEADESPWKAFDRGQADFQTRYTEALQRSSSHAEKLKELSALEVKTKELADETTKTQELISSLGSSEESYATAREEWLNAQSELADIIDRECNDLTQRSGNVIRVRVKRYGNASAFVEALRQFLTGSRIQGAKIEALGEAIVSAENPKAVWLNVLAEMEALTNFGAARSPTDVRPQAPVMQSYGFTPGDLDRVAQALKPDDWLSLSLISIVPVPIYEFRAREGEYIPFRNASAGQQATALLNTLLNQSGPPLIIDQPEEDLDNPVMSEIVEQIWKAKELRQIVFASHNANLVVNGDAELVAWFGYRTSGDQSRGTVKGEGAIDVPDARSAIKQIMEGGEAAFRLRREKYGF